MTKVESIAALGKFPDGSLVVVEKRIDPFDIDLIDGNDSTPPEKNTPPPLIIVTKRDPSSPYAQKRSLCQKGN